MNYFIQIQVIKEVEAPTTVVFNLLFTIGKQGLGGHILCADLSSYLLSLLNLSNLWKFVILSLAVRKGEVGFLLFFSPVEICTRKSLTLNPYVYETRLP